MDHLQKVSHEIILRILSHLQLSDLVTCHRVCRYLGTLATDSQLWSKLYFDRFVRPRFGTGRRHDSQLDNSAKVAAKFARWKTMEVPARSHNENDWKRQYKIKHNWGRGACSVNEICLSECPPSNPGLLMQMVNGTIFTVDEVDGLQAWNKDCHGGKKAASKWPEMDMRPWTFSPLSLAVNGSPSSKNTTLLAVGSKNGGFAIFSLDHISWEFRLVHQKQYPKNRPISAIALTFPYLAAMMENKSILIHKLDSDQDDKLSSTLLHTFQAQNILSPVALSIRILPSSVIVSAAFAILSYSQSWTIGIQEVSICPTTDTILDSRLSSADTFRASTTHDQSRSSAGPTTLSYNHPYLLSTHADNTLNLWLVTSTKAALTIDPARRLWGHTSEVSGATIDNKGKAVSVTKRGDDVRVWNLEANVRRKNARKPDRYAYLGEYDHMLDRGLSIRPCHEVDNADCSVSLSCKIKVYNHSDSQACFNLARGYIGFDEENVVLLRENTQKGQSLMVYNFA